MTMLFEPQYEEYKGEDLSDLIGDEWKEVVEESDAECDCDSECEHCVCK